MSYWKGLMFAAAVDLVWIMGSPLLAPERTPKPQQYKEEIGVVYVDRREPQEVDRLVAVSEQLDSLMMYLQEHPEDVDAIEKVADVYASNGWWDEAIGPLARAIELDPERWSLWTALNQAVRNAGMVMITDAELTVRAQTFVEAVEMWGHGC